MIRASSGHGGVVLVVDDIARNVQLLGATLTREGYEVLFATGGEMALERLEARLPDLVLLDLMMPGIDGMEVCRRIKQDPRTLHLPVIFLTAANESEIAAKALNEGAVDFITKPFNTPELLARVRTHVDLKRTRDELQRIIAQKNELMSAVAHDLKNPISSVRFSAYMLRDEGLKAPDPRAELVDTILESCDGLLKFIQDRLERSAAEAKLGQLQLEAVDVAELIKQVLRINMATAHAKQQHLTCASKLEGLPRVRADFHALGQVLGNLVSNAIKFSLPGTSVTITVTADEDSSDRLRVTVRDQGPGLTVDDAKDLFKPYRRLSARPTGGESSTGLGLSIAHDMIKGMGGTINCLSTPGNGAAFWISLPVASS
jgi:two-component system, sensor histidine kinase and response regulator